MTTKTKPKRRSPIVSTPASKAALQEYSAAIRNDVQAQLNRLERTWHWLACEVTEMGLTSKSTVMHWGRGLNLQVGSSVYVAVLDVLEREARKKRHKELSVRVGGHR